MTQRIEPSFSKAILMISVPSRFDVIPCRFVGFNNGCTKSSIFLFFLDDGDINETSVQERLRKSSELSDYTTRFVRVTKRDALNCAPPCPHKEDGRREDTRCIGDSVTQNHFLHLVAEYSGRGFQLLTLFMVGYSLFLWNSLSWRPAYSSTGLLGDARGGQQR